MSVLCTGLDWNLSGPQNPCPTKNETLVAAFKAVTTIEADEAVACLIIWEVEKKRKKGTHTHTHRERERERERETENESQLRLVLIIDHDSFNIFHLKPGLLFTFVVCYRYFFWIVVTEDRPCVFTSTVMILSGR